MKETKDAAEVAMRGMLKSQHHAGQISERLRSEADIGIAWAGARRR